MEHKRGGDIIMKKVRNGMFETNSSAVHTLVVADSGLEPSHLPLDKDGYILADFGNFDRDYHIYSSQEDKLSYLLTECYYLNGWHDDIRTTSYFMNIEDAICDYAGAKGIRILGNVEPYINHQEQPEYGFHFVNEWVEGSVINFVFNKYISIETNSD